jgi:RNA 2',3'-cyclic 3'-phosphodiesterase
MIAPRQNLFYALWPDEATRADLARLQKRIQGRLTRPQNLHLTLAFLGPQPEALLPLLRSILTHLEIAPMELNIDRLGYFSKNRIAWAGMHTTPEPLSHLQNMLAQELIRKGIPCEIGKAFRPHITLARRADAPSDLPFLPFRWHADQIVLAQSPLAGDEPLYRVLASQQCQLPKN